MSKRKGSAVLPQVPLLGGRYEVRDVLGRGATAEVRLGRDIHQGRIVAVKALRKDLAEDETLVARFRREIRSATSLDHASIVRVHDTGEYHLDGVAIPYMVMEYVDGPTLRALLRADGRLLPGHALQVIAEVLQALEHTHARGIVHRDIKPGNVMLTAAGAVKVMDWGVARILPAVPATMAALPDDAALSRLTVADGPAAVGETAGVIGTPQYLSPEQAKGATVDARSDLYSTGCLLYELLTGRPPFTGEVPIAVVYQHVRENPTPPSQVESAVPLALDDIVLKSLAKNPGDRYQCAEAMRADVERCSDPSGHLTCGKGSTRAWPPPRSTGRS